VVGYFKQCGWLDNVATVLAELAEKLDGQKLVGMADMLPVAWAQRLGYLLEFVDAEEVAQPLAEYIENLNPVRTPLLSSAGIKGSKYNSRWKVFENTEVEVEF
jgi:predicted transcriptional regulator of viral defense system